MPAVARNQRHVSSQGKRDDVPRDSLAGDPDTAADTRNMQISVHRVSGRETAITIETFVVGQQSPVPESELADLHRGVLFLGIDRKKQSRGSFAAVGIEHNREGGAPLAASKAFEESLRRARPVAQELS